MGGFCVENSLALTHRFALAKASAPPVKYVFVELTHRFAPAKASAPPVKYVLIFSSCVVSAIWRQVLSPVSSQITTRMRIGALSSYAPFLSLFIMGVFWVYQTV